MKKPKTPVSLLELWINKDEVFDFSDPTGMAQFEKIGGPKAGIPELHKRCLAESCPGAWEFWTRAVQCARTMTTQFGGPESPRPGLPQHEANEFFWKIVDGFIGKSELLKDGQRVLPRHINPNRSEFRRVEWADIVNLGLEGQGSLELLRESIGLAAWLFSGLLAVCPPVCTQCGAGLPPTKTGRRCKKKLCRRCENAAFYKRYSTHQGNRKKLQKQWRTSKSRAKGK